MSALKLKELQYETENLKRLLGFMSDENIHLKNRLTDILKNDFDNSLLEDVENFHCHFVQEDEKIRLLKNEVAGLDNLLAGEIFEDGTHIKKVNSTLIKLRNNLRNAEAQFANLKMEFNNYLSENIIQTT